MRVYACGVYLRGCALEDFLSPEFHFHNFWAKTILSFRPLNPREHMFPKPEDCFHYNLSKRCWLEGRQ